MQKNTQSSSGGVAQWLTAEWVYDTLMERIDPELVTANLPALKEKYANESAEEKQERMQRYVRAFEHFDRAFASLKGSLLAEAREVRVVQQKHAQESEQLQREEELKKIEGQFEDSSSDSHA